MRIYLDAISTQLCLFLFFVPGLGSNVPLHRLPGVTGYQTQRGDTRVTWSRPGPRSLLHLYGPSEQHQGRDSRCHLAWQWWVKNTPTRTICKFTPRPHRVRKRNVTSASRSAKNRNKCCQEGCSHIMQQHSTVQILENFYFFSLCCTAMCPVWVSVTPCPHKVRDASRHKK